MLSGIVEAAMDLIPGTAHASISLVTGRRKIVSEVASGDLPRQVDALQSSTGQGPCLDAAYEERVVRVPDLSQEDRWPEFCRGAVELGARSMLAFQLFVEGDRLGALKISTVNTRVPSIANPSRSVCWSPRMPRWPSRVLRRSTSSAKPWLPGS